MNSNRRIFFRLLDLACILTALKVSSWLMLPDFLEIFSDYTGASTFTVIIMLLSFYMLDCYSVAGESDYILQIVAADLAVLSDQVLRRLMRIKGVANIRSNIVLGCIKSTTELPLGHIGRQGAGSRRVRVT